MDFYFSFGLEVIVSTSIYLHLGGELTGYANSCPYEYQTAEQPSGHPMSLMEKNTNRAKRMEAKKEVNKPTKERDRLQKSDRNEEILAKYFTKSSSYTYD